jgi:hypothetical protein
VIKDDFKIGEEFISEPRWRSRWRCTDIGTRVIVAILINRPDSSWFDGPPYAVEEVVFDEYDMTACVPCR